MMESEIKIIFIDWFKTLSNSLFWSEWIDKRHEYHKYYKLIDNFLVERRILLNDWMRGRYSAEEICNILGKEIKLHPEIIFDNLKESCKKMTFVSDEIPHLIRKIRNKGMKVVIATDNMDTFRRFTIPALNLEELFDDFLISYELKRLKSDEGENDVLFFDSYIKKQKIRYPEAILLDDKIYKPEVYKNVGFRIIKIDGASTILESLRKYTF